MVLLLCTVDQPIIIIVIFAIEKVLKLFTYGAIGIACYYT